MKKRHEIALEPSCLRDLRCVVWSIVRFKGHYFALAVSPDDKFLPRED